MDSNEMRMTTLANVEYRIAIHMKGACENLLEVGRCLCEAKDSGLVSHGQWESWVQKNTGMSERSAQRLMQAARSVPAGSSMALLPVSKIQAILSLPEAEQEPMAERVRSEGLSLRALQEEVRRQKELASSAEERARLAEEGMASATAAVEHKMREEVEWLKAELSQAEWRGRQAEAVRSADALKAEQDRFDRERAEAAKAAKAELDRAQAALAEAEAYAEKQAELRQQAQRELINQRTQSTAAGTSISVLTADELSGAVFAFLGTAGVMPHMGTELAGLPENERRRLRQNVEMIRAWTDGAFRALDVVLIDAREG